MENKDIETVIIYDINYQLLSNLENFRILLVDVNKPYAQCKGCFGYWVKCPSHCVFKDKIKDIGKTVCNSKKIIVISNCVYGGLSKKVKRVWDRCIPGVLPFFTFRNKEMHHALRCKTNSELIFVFYGAKSEKERGLAKDIAFANATNFFNSQCKVFFYENAPTIEECFKL